MRGRSGAERRGGGLQGKGDGGFPGQGAALMPGVGKACRVVPDLSQQTSADERADAWKARHDRGRAMR